MVEDIDASAVAEEESVTESSKDANVKLLEEMVSSFVVVVVAVDDNIEASSLDLVVDD